MLSLLFCACACWWQIIIIVILVPCWALQWNVCAVLILCSFNYDNVSCHSIWTNDKWSYFLFILVLVHQRYILFSFFLSFVSNFDTLYTAVLCTDKDMVFQQTNKAVNRILKALTMHWYNLRRVIREIDRQIDR